MGNLSPPPFKIPERAEEAVSQFQIGSPSLCSIHKFLLIVVAHDGLKLERSQWECEVKWDRRPLDRWSLSKPKWSVNRASYHHSSIKPQTTVGQEWWVREIGCLSAGRAREPSQNSWPPRHTIRSSNKYVKSFVVEIDERTCWDRIDEWRMSSSQLVDRFKIKIKAQHKYESEEPNLMVWRIDSIGRLQEKQKKKWKREENRLMEVQGL